MTACAPEPVGFLLVSRAVLAVIVGTFTLRLSTGLTGGMLVFYLDDLGADSIVVGVFGALFYASELIGSPLFGILSDRVGHRRILLIGPAFGAIAVVMTALTTDFIVLGSTRILEGASTAASVPSILGFIAFATAGDELLRGKAVARFEAATLAGLMGGFVLAGVLWDGIGPLPALGPAAFLFNAALYGVSFMIYRLGVAKDAEPEPAHRAARLRAEAAGERHESPLQRYRRILTGSHVWLLAPTWIAINATLGLFTSQTLFQLIQKDPPAEFSNQLLMSGFEGPVVSAGLAAGGLLFFLGIFYWGNKFKNMRRTTIIFYGVLGGAALLAAAIAINHSQGFPLALMAALAVIAIGGLFVLAGATPAAIGLLADVTESYPDDRGAIMGLYSVFLGIGQIIGALVGGTAATFAGLDGILIAASVLLAIAIVPLFQLRRFEHYVAGPSRPAVLGGD
jgi:MFS family permease